MRCSYSCIEEARFKCQCKQSYMCATHLGQHLETSENHDFEKLNIDLGEPVLQNLRSEIFKRIQKIDQAKKLISKMTESLIRTIEKTNKEAIKRLDILRIEYFEILDHKKFCNSELPIIKKIETVELEIKTAELFEIMNQVEKVYEEKLENYLNNSRNIESEDRQRRENEEMNKKENEERLRKEKEEKTRLRKEEEERLRKVNEEERLKKEEEERRRIEEDMRLHPVSSNSFIEMSLKQKIDYFHPIVLHKVGYSLNDCHRNGREVLVSDDGKYLFFCKLYLGI